MATFTGTNGNDVLPPVGGNDSGADTMLGLGGNDTLLGGAGNDTLRGGTGSDSLQGQDGDDILDGGAGADTFLGGTGTDLVSYFASAAGVSVNLATNVHHGGDAEGDSFLDTIEIVHGSQFADTLLGSAGAETLRAQGGNDILRGLAGNDGLEGGAGADQLSGDEGDDTLIGGAGADRFVGGAGRDTLSYADAAAGIRVNLATGANGAGDALGDQFLDHIEVVLGSQFADTIIATASADELRGGGGNDTLQGGDGDDLLIGGAGADIFTGGNGTDTVSYTDSAQGVKIDRTAGTATGGTAQGDSFTQPIEVIIGSAFADVLAGSAGNDRFLGGAGNDTLSGAAGVDRLEGGDGDDTLRGGWGADSFIGGAGTDTVSYADNIVGVYVYMTSGIAGQGQAAGDKFLDHIERIVGSAFDDIMVGGAANDRFSGEDGNDTLRGADGNDSLSGGNGDDLLVGGAGADLFTGGAGFDTVSYADATIAATINASSSAGPDGDRYVDHIERFIGSAFADTFIGGAAATRFDGGDGNDTIRAGAGAETFTGGGGRDFITYSNSTAGVSINLETGVFTGGFAAGDTFLDHIEMVTGSNYADTLTGSDGAEQLSGGLGDDVIMGGLGADQILGSGDIDFASYADSAVGVNINLATNVATGGTAEGDTFLDRIEGIIGSAFDDVIVGKDWGPYLTDGGDILRGGDGNDALFANRGWSNRLEGDAGDDTLTGGAGGCSFVGGSGADRFVMDAAYETDPGSLSNGSTILDFSAAQGDKIDIGALTGTILFIGTAAFTGVAGQVRYEYVAANDHTRVSVDGDGDGVADLDDWGIVLTGNVTLTADDFVL
ncbi:calcium-binding protein [Inquilinus limosus]|uniref:Peptidase M10 serralysin C-terminal domain-containing protein n=1 Tax=Inquilinus limosus MP06 TaxID=1398085 RepID=A0A0A0D433_9PROT|nr:calcium-binding protein [Inquilinus limosus]KGM31817.1 hypothetical protein P409_24990 [Inquilinus limosus MP06]